ncbi:methyltransferase [Novosphingobium sp. TH158]|uniref:methyltransferase n=1 Tax=Novosphingobium sp. TH158 TaxID=2067455 RepID=UPI000C7CE331|nr:methyltransferase [Novosphingobium sp. TH158]PLK25926.1 methyltransferase [Novosphingobium sp. TH158]
MATSPPAIFSPRRRELALLRAERLQAHADAARFLADDAADDLLDRLAFLRHEPQRALVAGDRSGLLASALPHEASPPGLAFEQPWPVEGFDLIALPFVLDTANDLPGALIHARRALATGGLAFITLLGAGSLPVLREVMLAADGERPAPRLHPQVDVRAGGQLLQRAGFADPVVDSRSIRVRYGSLRRLVADLRAQGLGNQLADPGPPLTRTAWARAEAAFAALADSEGRVTETFEVLTLSGWKR